MSRYLSMSHRCSGCRHAVKDEADMLIEIDGTCIHVDHVTLIGVKLRTGFYGPYCDQACWHLDAQPGDTFIDAGRFSFQDEDASMRGAELGFEEPECEGHPAGPCDPMGQTVYCDGSCRSEQQ